MKIKILLQSLALICCFLWMIFKAYEITEPYGLVPFLSAAATLIILFICGVGVIDSQIDHQVNEESPE